MTEVLNTKRLELRRPSLGDAEMLAQCAGSLEVSQWMTSMPHPYTLKDAKEFIDRQIAGDGNVFFLFSKNALAGCIGTKYQLGYWLTPKFWGKGFATEAGQAIVQRHFGQGHDALISGHFLGNNASRAVLKKLGFHDTEVISANCRATGLNHRLQRMTLLKSDLEVIQ
jgi:RimJ/RimL family protein N-acetyltransferase